MSVLEHLVPELAGLPGTVAVVLGGSRARGTHHEGSDWDIGLYYRGSFDAAELGRLGYEGHTAQPGEWGRIINGGAWLSVGGQPVDVLLRDLDQVEQWWADAREGRFDIDNVEGHLAGLPTYVPVGEMAIALVLRGTLPNVAYPPALRDIGARRWRWNGAFSLLFASHYAETGDRTACGGMLARAAMQTAHAIHAERSEWVLGEKRLLDGAGLACAHEVLATAGSDAPTAVEEMRRLIDPPPLDELGVHDTG